MKSLVFIFLFLTHNAFSQENSRFPIRLKSIHIDYAQYKSELDIINMFSDHLRLKAETINNLSWGLSIRLLSFLDALYYQDTYTLTFPTSSNYLFDEYEFEYKKSSYGFRFHFFNIALELGTGERKFHTFLETDTTYYFHREVVSPHSFIKLHYTYATSLMFDMNLFYEQTFFHRATTNDIQIDVGDTKHFGLKLIFGSKYQLAPFFSHSYTSIKLIHNFFGLKNEMSNQYFEEKLGITLIYNY